MRQSMVLYRAVSCVDGPRLARDNFACRTEVACSHVSGLFTQSAWTAGPDGVREPRPHHSSGIEVPMRRQASLDCAQIEQLEAAVAAIEKQLMAWRAASSSRWLAVRRLRGRS